MSSMQLILNNCVSSSSNHLHRLFNLDRETSSVVRINGRRVFSACLNMEVDSSKVNGSLGKKLGCGQSKDVMEADGKVIVGTYARSPVVLASGKGCKLYDVEGKEYLDMSSGIAVNALGHGDSDWLEAVVEQANTLTHVSNLYYSIPQVELAKRLVASSFADRVFFSNSGAEANEAAIKFARKFQRHSYPDEKEPATEFISFTNCFHGRTMGALALTSKEYYRSPFQPVMPGVTFVEYGNIQATKEVIKRGKTAAVFVEPLQGEGGIYSATKEFLQYLRNACDEAGALLVFDEIQCGLGRTGYLWAHKDYGVYPDIMTLAKPLAGGLPIGAVLVTEKVASAINYGDHGSTFAGSPLVCNAALAVFNKISNPDFLASVSKKGQYLKKILAEKLGENPHVKEIRGLGLIVGIELDVSASPLVDACRDAGLLILTAGKARAPGKIILSGEHAVVHGSTAVASSIDLYTYVSLRFPTPSENDGALKLHLKDLALEFSWPIERLQNSLPNPVSPIPSTPTSCSPECFKLLATLVENIPEAKIGLASGVLAFLWLYTNIQGYKPATVVITSELPMGSGLGSSASLCVSLAAALLALSDAVTSNSGPQGWLMFGESELDLVNRWAFEGEKIIHGKPSGIDNTVSTYGNMIKFKSGSLTRIKSNMPLKMLITNTKIGRNTKALVAGVSERTLRHPEAMLAVFNAVDSISKDLSTIIESPSPDDISVTEKEEKLEELLEMNQGLLQCMGVSHASIETVLRTTLKYKLASKLTGAGGGGCVLTLLPTLLSRTVIDKVIAELESCGFQCLMAEIGGNGLEICFGDSP